MNNFVELPISLNILTTAVDEIMKKRGYAPAESTEGKTIKMKEFAQKYCGGKAMPWIRLFIFDEFPEIDFKNGGWVVNSRKSDEGSKTFIFEKPAAEWMEKHRKEIDNYLNRKDIKQMAAFFKRIHRRASDHQKVINNLIASSDCWASRSDLCSLTAGISTRNIKRARLQSDSIKYI